MSVDRRDILMDLYRAFNDRDLEAAVEPLAPDVDWPNVTTGGRVHGRDAVRRYWQKQWSEIDPRVEPLEVTIDATGLAHVRVDQLVRSLDGKILQNRQIEHVFEFAGPFIASMTIIEPENVEDDNDE